MVIWIRLSEFRAVEDFLGWFGVCEIVCVLVVGGNRRRVG